MNFLERAISACVVWCYRVVLSGVWVREPLPERSSFMIHLLSANALCTCNILVSEELLAIDISLSGVVSCLHFPPFSRFQIHFQIVEKLCLI
jgi:hypothetical protein